MNKNKLTPKVLVRYVDLKDGKSLSAADKTEYEVGKLVRYLNRWQGWKTSGFHRSSGQAIEAATEINNGQLGLVIQTTTREFYGARAYCSRVIFDEQTFTLFNSFLIPVEHSIFLV